MELLLGCGSNRTKKLAPNGNHEWNNLVTVDFNADHKPDIVHDLENIPLPFEDNSADQCHIYDCWEHIGKQGDFRTFFAQFEDYWRILKPDGLLMIISPHVSSIWAWGDPGHTRVASSEMLVFLNQEEYTKQVGKTPMSDYRFCYKADFDIVHAQITEDRQFRFVLRAVKPSRISI
jgi:SAM-dependent methyltransferase